VTSVSACDCECVCLSVSLSVCPRGYNISRMSDLYQIFEHVTVLLAIGEETSVPLQLAQCWFPGLAICKAKIQMYFSNKIYQSCPWVHFV